MRLHLTFALITALLLVITLGVGRKPSFGFAQVRTIAEERARTPYAPLPDGLPSQLQRLSPSQDAGIFWKEAYRLWRNKGLPFQVDFYHPLNSNPSPHISPAISTVDYKGPHRLAYSPVFFNFLKLKFNPPLPASLGYAGFYLRYPLPIATEPKPGMLNGFFSVLGGNYFRVLAEKQVYGLSARGLAINTGIEGATEEFPQFTDWWLNQPGPGATELVLDAVLDSPSLTGAYEFKIRPGGVTAVDIHASLFFRKTVSRLGIAPFSSMYLFGENAKNHFGDSVHQEIHDSDGVVINTGKGGWIWRPLQQAAMLQLYDFGDENPKGFGLVQRDRDFTHYEDLDALYNVRPSAWVIPHGDWGKGSIQLTELPTNNTNTDNVVLFWRPDKLPRAGDHLDLDYTVEFYMNDGARPPLAYCKSTFVNDPAPPPLPPPPSAGLPPVPGPDGAPGVVAAHPFVGPPAPPPKPSPSDTVPVQFLVDFMGNGLENLAATSPPDLELHCSPPETVVRESKVEKNSYDNSWRVTFTIIPLKHHVPTELRCCLFPHDSVRHLQKEIERLNAEISQPPSGDDPGVTKNLRETVLPQKEKALKDIENRPLSETWTYTWHQ